MSDNDQYTDTSNYGYTPSSAWCTAFIVMFSVSALIHSLQAWRAKYWVVYPTLVLGALIEILGWSGRLWSSENVLFITPFLVQICTLIMAPVFFSAFDYIMLGIAIRRLGPQYSVLRPMYYFIVFLIADIVSLILQAVGGGQAASSAADSAPTDSATTIMVVGICVQLASMGVFVALGFDFIIRANSKKSYAFRERQIESKTHGSRRNSEKMLSPEISDSSNVAAETNAANADLEGQTTERENLNRWWLMLAGCLISSIAIVIRGVFRSIELSDGWDGPIATNENLTNLLDGLPMIIAVGIFNVIHPLFVLPRRKAWKGFH